MAKTEEKKMKRKPLGKPFVVGEFVKALASIAGCNPGDFAKVTEIKHDGAMIRGEFVTGQKSGSEFLAYDTALDAVATASLPPNVKSVLKIK